ncbi:MAG: tRNA 2-thiocytidine(32) synthetase TtcA [Deltaproteobacteria bacterium]|nr:tRNA 2-thiocytidine(32) synthetase TtcA [Deltaproteobacteria bacterium]
MKKRLLHDVGRAIADFDLIAAGDRILVALSGGKDSYALLLLLEAMRRRAPVSFGLVAVHLDQGHPGHDPAPLLAWLAAQGFEHKLVREDTYGIVKATLAEQQTPCSLCARLRRAILYRVADDLGCTKVALGHHRDDAVETLLLNLFFAGKLAAMPARLTSDDRRHVVIRPLIYCAASDLAELAARHRVPLLPCRLCDVRPQAQRKQIKLLLDRLEVEYPHVRQTMLAALGNVHGSHLLAR